MTDIAKELAKISRAYTEFCIAHTEATPKGCPCDSCLFRHLPCLATPASYDPSEYDWSKRGIEFLNENSEYKEEA